MAGRRSPCKIKSFRTDPPREVCGLLGVSGNIDGDGSTLSAFMDAEQFERVPNRPSDLGRKICERRDDLSLDGCSCC